LFDAIDSNDSRWRLVALQSTYRLMNTCMWWVDCTWHNV
jgi:hypothetical protein